ncbi:hypothetical protein POX_a01654 [Penicillium oxalicum]|uniref:hypothetical protein n=1 Tax=Penicillium oxalicum TaxID=69781 RepID=UPI0020B65514|nr:hypothetical protein POX_a01654 [Penicillium oxalicum]KAI2795051.1 hypothetical protein POX_a01654 [Penicillium oxalicum]
MTTPSADEAEAESQTSPADLSISLSSSFALLYYLFYLNVLYGISRALQLFKAENATSPSLDEAIKCKEARVLAILTQIAPHRIYRSPVPSSVFTYEYSTTHRVTAGHLPAHVGLDGEYNSTPRSAGMRKPLPTYFNGATRSNLPSILITPEGPVEYHGHVATARSPLRSDTFIPPNGASSSVPRPSFTVGSWRDHRVLFTEPVVSERRSLCEEREQRPSLDVVRKSCLHHTHPLKSGLKSISDSTDNQQETMSAGPRLPFNSTSESTALSMSSNRAIRTRSVESYPGRFPVSEGLEFSSLASAASAFREKGTTHARPFSDY